MDPKLFEDFPDIIAHGIVLSSTFAYIILTFLKPWAISSSPFARAYIFLTVLKIWAVLSRPFAKAYILLFF